MSNLGSRQLSQNGGWQMTASQLSHNQVIQLIWSLPTSSSCPAFCCSVYCVPQCVDTCLMWTGMRKELCLFKAGASIYVLISSVGALVVVTV